MGGFWNPDPNPKKVPGSTTLYETFNIKLPLQLVSNRLLVHWVFIYCSANFNLNNLLRWEPTVNSKSADAINPGSTMCLRSSNSFYIVTYYMKWVTTFWTYSIFKNTISVPYILSRYLLYVQEVLTHFIINSLYKLGQDYLEIL